MEATELAVFKRAEWVRGMNKLGFDSKEKLVAALPRLRAGAAVSDEQNFKRFYAFVYGLSKEPGQKVSTVYTLCVHTFFIVSSSIRRLAFVL